VEALLRDLERQGPEEVGAPLRAVALLATDVGQLHGGGDNALARRRRRAVAARLARRAASLAAAVPVARDAGGYVAAVRELAITTPIDARAALGRVAALTLRLPEGADADDWEAMLIAFADEEALAELRQACMELGAAALTQM
jgi:hypothetical protein